MTDPFADIRPFSDAEVRPTIERLLGSREFLTAMLRLRLGAGAEHFAWLLRPLARYSINRQFRHVHSVLDLQVLVKAYVERMIESTTTGFSVSGLDLLDSAEAYLFISNHRDIAMDPAFTNYALYSAGHDTLRIAIGDNLLTEQWVADLMRLNKSFIVQRSLSGPRELLAASQLLARYIRSSVQEDQVPVWIAQREGRAKDGVDRTEPAIIKMLSLSRDKQSESFAEHIAGLRIVPVTISYELDPCDAMKSRELASRSATGGYEKAVQEDVASIGQGIAGDKGRVHVSFGTPLDGPLDNPAVVATAIDAQIVANYRLHPPNLWAYQRLYGEPSLSVSESSDATSSGIQVATGSCSEEQFDARIAAMPEAQRPFALAAYANAFRGALELAGAT
ncbi:MAG: 1-acyl-sn-glycerol-3-phosphate acyltransferase [Congregibacter sp.]